MLHCLDISGGKRIYDYVFGPIENFLESQEATQRKSQFFENGKEMLILRLQKSFFEIYAEWLHVTLESFLCFQIPSSYILLHPLMSRQCNTVYFMVVRRLVLNICKEITKKVDFPNVVRMLILGLQKKLFCALH